MSSSINVSKQIKILDEGVLLTSDVSQIDFTGGVTATTSGNNVTVNVPAAGITVGTTAVTSGTDGRVFFQAGGVVQQDANFTFDNTLKRLTLKAVGTAATDIPLSIGNSAGTVNLLQQNGVGSILARSNDTFSYAGLFYRSDGANGWSLTNSHSGYAQGTGIETVGNNLYFLNTAVRALSVSTQGTGTFKTYGIWNYGSGSGQRLLIGENVFDPQVTLSGTGNLGIGTYTAGARLDVRAQGALSTDIAFRVRNSADTEDLFSVRGNKDIYFPSTGGGSNVVKLYANLNDSGGPNTLITYGRKGTGNISIGEASTFTAGGFQQTVYGLDSSTASDGSTAIGHSAIVDASSTAGISIGRYARGFGSSFIAIGTGPAANQTFGGTNTIVLGNRSGAFGININNVFFTYFASNNVTTITRDNGSFGLLGQQVEVRDSTQLTNNMGNGGNTLVVMNHTAVPSTNITNAFQLYSNDITAGNAAPHFRTENGAIVKVYQETTAVGASTLVGGGGTTLTDTDTFDGYTLKQIVKALRNQGLLA